MAKANRARKPMANGAETQVSVSDARTRLTELVNRAAYGAERFVIMRRGKRVAALVGAREIEHCDGAA